MRARHPDGGAGRTLSLLRKEWPEQRRGLLLALSLLLVLWAAALAATLLPEVGGEAAQAWLAAWALRGFPLGVLTVLLPAHALLAGAGAFAPGSPRTSHAFLETLPVEMREIWASRLLAAAAAVAGSVAAFWACEGLLWLLARRPAGVAPFPLRSTLAGIVATAVATLPALGSGLLAGAGARSRGQAVLAGAALLVGLHLTIGGLAAADSRYGWWVPPWALGSVAAAVALATASLALAERDAAGPVSRTGHAAGAALAAGLGAIALWWGANLSLRPSEAEGVDVVAASPSGETLVLAPRGASRLWRWEEGDAEHGLPAGPLPGLDVRPLGWGPDGRAFYYIRSVPWGEGRQVVVSLPDGSARPVLDLPGAEGAPGSGASVVLLHEAGSGRVILADGSSGALYAPGAGRLAEVPAGFRSARWWGREILFTFPDGRLAALAPDTLRLRDLPLSGEAHPFRRGRYLAVERPGGGDLVLWDDETGQARTLARAGNDSPVWAHHLESLYYLDGQELTAWHPEVGVRPLLGGVEAFRVLPGGARILARRAGGATVVLHAGTRDVVPLALPPRADPMDPRRSSFSPDGRWMAVLGTDGLHLLDLGTGRATRITDAATRRGWVSWISPGRETARAAGGPRRGLRMWARTGEVTFALLEPGGASVVAPIAGTPRRRHGEGQAP